MTADDEMPMDEALAAARAAGAEHGAWGASWTFDGNTPRAAYEAAVAGLADGDPMTYDALGGNEPDLHHEYSARDLCDEIGVDYDLTSTREVDLIADAYVEEAQNAYWAEVERAARAQLTS